MPVSHSTKDTLIQHLLAVFRQYGYEGATLTRISAATGLGKASLYHHFPQGKVSMVNAVLEYAGTWFATHVFEVLAQKNDPSKRLEEMLHNLSKFYKGGDELCMLSVLVLGDIDDTFKAPIQEAIKTWVAAISTALIDAGIPKAIADERAEDAVLRIQGALIVSRGLDDHNCFKRTMKQLPKELLAQI